MNPNKHLFAHLNRNRVAERLEKMQGHVRTYLIEDRISNMQGEVKRHLTEGREPIEVLGEMQPDIHGRLVYATTNEYGPWIQKLEFIREDILEAVTEWLGGGPNTRVLTGLQAGVLPPIQRRCWEEAEKKRIREEEEARNQSDQDAAVAAFEADYAAKKKVKADEQAAIVAAKKAEADAILQKQKEKEDAEAAVLAAIKAEEDRVLAERQAERDRRAEEERIRNLPKPPTKFELEFREIDKVKQGLEAELKKLEEALETLEQRERDGEQAMGLMIAQAMADIKVKKAEIEKIMNEWTKKKQIHEEEQLEEKLGTMPWELGMWKLSKVITAFKNAAPPGPAAAGKLDAWLTKIKLDGLNQELTGKEPSEKIETAVNELQGLDPDLMEAYVTIGEVTGMEDGGPVSDIAVDMHAAVFRRRFDEAEEEAAAKRVEEEERKRAKAAADAEQAVRDSIEKIAKLKKMEKEYNIQTEEDLMNIM